MTSNKNADPATIANIINSLWPDIHKRYNSYQLRILDAIRRCRTPSLGGHLYNCDNCGRQHYRYNSCRNRHCPQCQNTDKERWILARSQQLIDAPYFHIVFTIPDHLNELCLAYPRQLYDMIFKSAWQTLHEFGWHNKYLGAHLGATMVLHTWGANMSFHPHVHCIVPGGGINLFNQWIHAKGNGKFIVPVKALSAVFRGKFINALKDFFNTEGLDKGEHLFNLLYKKQWVVYAKPPFGGPEAVIKYLARYTHKVAITHHRIINWNPLKVTFYYTDYRHANQKKVMTLDTKEFLRRYVLHFLPKGFPRIRHYGILSSAWKKKVFPHAKPIDTDWISIWKAKGIEIDKCPYCKKGRLLYISKIKPVRGPPYRTQSKSQTHIHVNHA